MTVSTLEVTDRTAEQQFRGATFSADHLWEYAEQIAERQTVAKHNVSDSSFAKRFEDNCSYITTTYEAILDAVRGNAPISPAAEWLVDNYYVVQEQLREIREDLPRDFYLELPKLSSTPFTGFPRVYELAHELAAHTDSSLDEELIRGFAVSYQRVTALTSGELWALPIMLRLVLVEHLRQLCERILLNQQCHQRAGRIFEAWQAGNDATSETLDASTLPRPLIMELIERFRCIPTNDPTACWRELAARLSCTERDLEDCAREQRQHLAANQVSIGNVITSMRLVSALDWSQFFERVSLVEESLRRDPAGIYSLMDFPTRDYYRHIIERLAKRSTHDETHAATAALEMALDSQCRQNSDWRSHHIGYYLLDDGRHELEKKLGYRPSIGEGLTRAAKRWPGVTYWGSIAAMIVTMIGMLAAGLAAAGSSVVTLVVLITLAIVPLSELAVSVVNFLVTIVLRPQLLPRLDFSAEIPDEYATLVVMPTMLTPETDIQSLVERLEIQFLANPERGLTFALLTDFADASQQETPDDDRLLATAQRHIDELNDRYDGGARPRFYLLHRRRLWNADAKLWMGWERKRGKLAELNGLLRGDVNTSYMASAETQLQLRPTRFVITLDSDTRLPHAGARKLAGALAHPQNQPLFDGRRKRVTRGYGVLQPRVSVSLASAGRSRYSQIFSNGGGLDPYCTAVSDVYQDLFGEANFTGKGIYDVDAFAAAVDDSFPENHILSHDLIEGCFARVGAATDVEVFDEYPTRFDADLRRQHRWIRGDWQLLPWLLPMVPSAHAPRPNPLSALSRWKICDNLRRSLVPLTLTLYWIVGWLAQPHAGWLISLSAVAILACPFLFHLTAALIHWPRTQDKRQHLSSLAATLRRSLVQCGLAIAFLPLRAYNSADAIVRTLYRLFVSRSQLLEWETADATERRLAGEGGAAWHKILAIPAAAAGLAMLLPQDVVGWAMPILAGWAISPWIAHWISQPIPKRTQRLSPDDEAALRRIARRTWAFFEAYVGPEGNWLPPDNYQEFPQSHIAQRISPTNEGMYILSAIAARDFGFVGIQDLVTRLEDNIEQWTQLPHYEGHPFNWYDTTTLAPLTPRYISTADNGNLAASLLAAQQGMLDVSAAPIFSLRIAEGVRESVRLVQDTLDRLQPRGARFVSPALDALESQLASIAAAARQFPRDTIDWPTWVRTIHDRAIPLPNLLTDVQKGLGMKGSELAVKVGLLRAHVEGLHQDCDDFFGWIALFDQPDVRSQVGSGDADLRATLRVLIGQKFNLWDLVQLPDLLAPHFENIRAAVQNQSLTVDEPHVTSAWLADLKQRVMSAANHASLVCDRLQHLSDRYESLAMRMNFQLIYDPDRRLFSVGFNLEEGRLDRAHYDLLASEARIASQVAIAKGDVDHRHWFQLGRSITETSSGKRGLLSWGGTMFEYLMPALFVQYVEGSLLEQSCEMAVERQIAYGKQQRVPWGISESAFSVLGANSDYHYQSFGVPGLGLKRGLGKALVISPYSTALALQIKPGAAVANFRRLIDERGEGPWGFYDAIDYTPDHLPVGERRSVVYNYMAHHQGMTLLALANGLLEHCVQRRFQRHPLIRSTELLMQERTPISVLKFQPQEESTAAAPQLPMAPGPVSRHITTARTSTPRAHLLSNGQYHVMLTNAGGGYSKCGQDAVTRWQSDRTCDNWGQFLYLRDLTDDRVWSAAYQPTRIEGDSYDVIFSIDKAEFRRRDGDMESHLEVTVSPENNVEVRQVTLTNHGRRPARLELTSYAEIVLGSAAADTAHPAFNKLFVETEYIPEYHALLARRRPRDANSETPWAVHVLAAPHAASDHIEYETDRGVFLGRGNSVTSPAAVRAGRRLQGTTGPVLDAIFALRCRLEIAPDATMSAAFVTGYANSREEALQLADQFRDPRAVQRTFEMAWARCQVEMRHLHTSPANVQLYQRLVSSLLYPGRELRGSAEAIRANRQSQSALWRHGISGDDPVVLLQVAESSERELLRELLLAHEFWHSHGLKVDLVVINDNPAGYFDEFQEQLLEVIRTTSRSPMHKSGGVYLLRSSQLTTEDTTLLQAVAAIHLNGKLGSLATQLAAKQLPDESSPQLLTPVRDVAVTDDRVGRELPEETLLLSGPHGGFAPNGDYVIRSSQGALTPLPWSNVIANPRFGCLVTESGGGYTWGGNSRENKLTSWSNDPITDQPSEVIYLRDEESGKYWSATPRPAPANGDFRIRHGRGSSQFSHQANGICSELSISIAANSCAKFMRLKLRNLGRRSRHISATCYVEWVLGVHRQQMQMHVRTSQDAITGALVAQNSYHEDFALQAAFLHVIGGGDSITGDRSEFLGRNGAVNAPAAMHRKELSNVTGVGLDPCGAVQKQVQIAAGEEIEIIFLLGWTDDASTVATMISTFDTAQRVEHSVQQTHDFWQQACTTIEVSTPNPAFDMLVNHWLIYQTLSCRVWGRSAFYQSGGAFGYRDQLQDIMALVYSLPHVARQMILQAAARQFEQGDVQHWWHPPTGRGVRTRFADDFLWLPLSVSHYVNAIGDDELLTVRVPYLHSPPLGPHEHERYELPEISTSSDDIFGHCLRAIDHALRFGAHGLPLMGGGDWNDGMNRVGVGGQGESVWMGWFLAVVLDRFIPFVELRGDLSRANKYREHAQQLRQAIEREAWDGQWYRRAFFDDGTPLGSAANDECQIDSLAQSWAVIAGGDATRTEIAIASAEKHLVRESERLLPLLTPPFDKTTHDPGYIKGYVPGVRENGGQYTHAAMWLIQAIALQGRGNRAMELLDLINPILNANAPQGSDIYRGEPYVVAADVYSTRPHVGRVGWTWYTGSAAWMYRVAIETILGLELRGDRLSMRPCIPSHWADVGIIFRRGATSWEIHLSNPAALESGDVRLQLDGKPVVGSSICLNEDGGQHLVEATLQAARI